MIRLTYFSEGKWRIQLGYTEYSGEKVDQIALYEDMLCEGYGLYFVQKLIETITKLPHKCKYCIGCEVEPKDGHGCDGEHDSFVFSIDKLKDLLKTDVEENFEENNNEIKSWKEKYVPGIGKFYECPECGMLQYFNNKFCPNCGIQLNYHKCGDKN